MDVDTRFFAALDAAHAGDPERIDGVAAELRYADRISHWVGQLVPHPSPALALAARAQHLERWVIPRSDFPLDKPGYLRWRKSVQLRQGARAREILLAAGCDATLAERVAVLVAKGAARDAEGQALEDAACLTFIEGELAEFAAQHVEYPRAKFVDIIAKTWRKMSPAARDLALGLTLDPEVKALVVDAVAPR